MSPETLHPAPREIKFGGEGKAEDIKRGFAITTLRNPRPAYDFHPGEVISADCFDDNEKVPVVVLTNETKKLKDFSIPQLALDGFFSANDVIKGMKTYPGYEKLNNKYELKAITFVKQESFNTLSDLLRETIYNGERFDELVKLTSLRHLFFPTMCHHMAGMGGKLNNWIEFLKDYSLITFQEKAEMEGYQYVGGITMSRLLKTDPKILRQLSLEFADKGFKPLILGIFE